MNIQATVSEVSNNLEKLAEIKKALDYVKKNQVLIGIPEEAAGHTGEINNVQLAYIHSNGSPINNIPARPFIEPAINKHKQDLTEKLKNASEACYSGNQKGAESSLKSTGLLGQNFVKAEFRDNDWPDISEATKKAKKSTGVLIDTGQLRNSITYVVRSKNA